MTDVEQPDASTDQGDPAESVAPKDSKPWLNLIATGKKAFAEWQAKSDNIEKLYANLGKLAATTREREFQLFWANIQVLGPSIYSRPPVPVVTPKFKDRDPLIRTSCDLLERAAIVTNDEQDIDSVMLNLRDDLTTVSRGQVWIIRDDDGYVVTEHVDRHDFLHDPARKWKEVDWVAKCSWLTKSDARKRFKSTSADAYKGAGYVRQKEKDNPYGMTEVTLKAPFWELWSKSQNKVVWITEGVDKVLDEGPPHLDLENFFPCPKPVYGTCQRNTLIPVPDMLFYKDQLEEINETTGRIGALTEAVKVRGFYPSGAGNISDAIEAAMKRTANNVTLEPVANWQSMGESELKDAVMWWPIEQIVAAITSLIELRKQLINDVYEITGLSDIMRGSTVASETLGAQKLKSQYGSVRIRDRQAELVRMARDITRISCEIIAEHYSQKDLLDMTHMKLPTDADIKGQVKQLTAMKGQIEQEAQKAKQDPQIQQKIQQNPDQAQQIMQQVQDQLQQIDQKIQATEQTITIDAVMKFLRDNRMRCFTLDIETDSTIQPDEDATKQRASEYITAMSTFLQQAVPAVEGLPQLAPLMADMLNFVNSQFRIGRSMEASVEEFADQMKQLASQPKPNPDAQQAQIDAQTTAAQQEIDKEKNQIASQEVQAKSQGEDARRGMEWKKALVAALTSIEVASIGAKAKNDGIALAAQMEAQINLMDQAHEVGMTALDQSHDLNMQGIDQAHQATMQDSQNAAQAAMAPADGDGTQPAAPAPQQPAAAPPSALMAMLQKQLANPSPMQPQAAPPANDNTDILQAIQRLTLALAAPKQITTPDGRIFTSRPVMH